MLKLAIEAGIPLITVQTDDTINVGKVLSAIAEIPVESYKPNLKPKIKKGGVYYTVPLGDFDFPAMYRKFTRSEAVLLVVNPTIGHSAAYSAGIIAPPKSMIEDFVAEYSTDKNRAKLVTALAGLSFEQVFQVSKLAMAKHGQLTAKAVRDIRRTFFSAVRGLQMLSTDFLYYDPALPIQEWLETSGRFLIEFEISPLTPRGLLFNGPPGVGKTMAAKHIARVLDLPLYHLDIAALFEKYLGDTEGNLRMALNQAEQSAPCILLMDEVEKLFNTGTEDSGVTSRMLSSILWWLQEHKKKVLTVMTTNNQVNIPRELYRQGRIDFEIYFNRLEPELANRFATNYCDRLCKALGVPYLDHESEFFVPHSHAEVVGVVNEVVREKYIKAKKDTVSR